MVMEGERRGVVAGGRGTRSDRNGGGVDAIGSWYVQALESHDSVLKKKMLLFNGVSNHTGLIISSNKKTNPNLNGSRLVNLVGSGTM